MFIFSNKLKALAFCLIAPVCTGLASQEPPTVKKEPKTWLWTIDMRSLESMIKGLTSLAEQYNGARDAGLPANEILVQLRKYLAGVNRVEKNPWNGFEPAYVARITAVGDIATSDDFEAILKTSRASMGRGRFFIQFPTASAPGFIGGAVRVAHYNLTAETSHKMVLSEDRKFLVISIINL